MTDQITVSRELLRQALAQLEINRRNFYKGPSKSICKMLAGGNDEAIDKLRAALEQPAVEPYGWHVTGCNELLRGEYAQSDAELAAKRCGGTAKAVAVYTAPQPPKPISELQANLAAQERHKPTYTGGPAGISP